LAFMFSLNFLYVDIIWDSNPKVLPRPI
jgi:hypothetical protein